jgi:hypothetical protein
VSSSVGELAPERRVEGAGVGRIQLEDVAVRLRRIADREPPLLQRRQVPQRPEARPRVVQRLALPREHTRQRRRVPGPAAERLQRAQGRHVVALLDQQRLEQRRRARRLLVHLHEQGRQLERHRLRRARRRRPLDALREQRRQLAETPADRVLSPSGHDAREALGGQVVIRHLRERALVGAHRRRVVAEA